MKNIHLYPIIIFLLIFLAVNILFFSKMAFRVFPAAPVSQSCSENEGECVFVEECSEQGDKIFENSDCTNGRVCCLRST